MNGIVRDRFEIKGQSALEYGAAGVVVMVAGEPQTVPPVSGEPVLLVRLDGWLYHGRAEDVRTEAPASLVGVFLRGLTADEVPIGSRLRWGADLQAPLEAVA